MGAVTYDVRFYPHAPTADMVKSAVRQWRKRCAGRKTVCFCVNIEHSMAVAREFTRKGISAVHVDGNTCERCRVLLTHCAGTLVDL